MAEAKPKEKVLEELADMKLLMRKLKLHGKVITGFQRCIRELESKEPLIVIMASDCGEMSFKRIVLDACQKHDVYVSSRHAKQVLAEILGCKEKEASIAMVLDFGSRWTAVDKKEFERFFIK